MNGTNTIPTVQQVNGAFLAMMQAHRQGGGLTDWSEAMQTVTRAVMEAGRPGSFSLKVTIKPATKSSGGAMVVVDEVKTSLPKQEPTGSIFFGDFETGRLLRDNPRQFALPLAPVAQSGGGMSVTPVAAAEPKAAAR
jgi:hypothetical protein